MHHVISVANISQADFLQAAKLFLQSEVIGQGLAGMLNLAQRVDHRYAGEIRHALHSFVRKRPQHDSTHPALKIMGDITQGLTRVQAFMTLVHE